MPFVSIDKADESYGPVDLRALSKRLSRSAPRTAAPRSGAPESWKELPTEGIYQIAVSEELEGALGSEQQPLERGSGRTFAVAAVLDLGLRMLESLRGRYALEDIALRVIHVWLGKAPLSSLNNAYEPLSAVELPQREVRPSAAVAEFLRCVRHQFPAVRLDGKEGFFSDDGGGETEQKQQPRGSPSAPREQRLSFNPKAAAVLHLDRELADKLYQARLKADLARRRRDHVEQVVQTTRFRRLQFHASVGVAHHLCHLFVGFLRNFGGLAAEVADDDVLSLVAQYDAGSEFEAAFFGGCPKMFLDVAALFDQKYSRQSYVGRSYLVRSERDDKGRRTASAICQHMIDSYLQGDFSAPLLSDDEGGFDDYRDLKDKYDLCGGRTRQRSVPNLDEAASAKEGGRLSVPWNIVGTNYKLLRKSCFDPSVRIVDLYGQRMKSKGP